VRRLSGGLRSSLIIGGQGIRARKLRTLLSMLSLFLGVLAVVVVQTGAETARRVLLSNVELTAGVDGTRTMYLPIGPGVSDIVRDVVRGRPDAVVTASTQGIIGEPEVTPINPGGVPLDQVGPGFGGGYSGEVQCNEHGCFPVETRVGPPGQAIELGLVAMTGDIRQFKPFRPHSGRWLDFESAPSLSPRLVVNISAAKAFVEHRIPAELRIRGALANPTPRIVGVIDDGQPQPMAYLRADEMATWLPDADLTRIEGGLQMWASPAASDVETVLRRRLVGVGIGESDMYVEVVQARESTEDALALVRAIFLGMAGLVLLIGVAGILNVGLATVGERIEEFALRRAVGTPRLLLAGIVLAETMFTGLFTAGAAIGLSAAALKVIAPFVGEREPALQNLAFPWQAAVAGIVAGLIAGLLGGLVPAIRAARIPIATVMRA
jgi:putative ABC transport system permease protein